MAAEAAGKGYVADVGNHRSGLCFLRLTQGVNEKVARVTVIE